MTQANPPLRSNIVRGGPPAGPFGLKERLLAHIEIWRLDLFSYAGLVGVAGALFGSDDPALWRIVGAWLAPTFGWLAAMYGGDYFDRDLDATSKPQRPVPSGRVTARGAFLGMVINVLLGLVVAAVLNPLNVVVVFVTLGLGVAYNASLKSHGVLGNVSRGGVTAMAFVMGTLATDPDLQPELLPLALIFWLHDSGSNVVGAICDREGDREGGYGTFPVRHGDTASLWLMLSFDVAWVSLAIWYPLTLDDVFSPTYAGFLAVAVVMAVVSAGMLFRSPRPIPRLIGLRAHEVLVIERLVLTAGLVATVTSAVVGVLVFLPSAAAALVASVAIMRRSYEPSRHGWRKKAGGHSRVL
ncbi:UbiA family prenyltransferase [Streptomyces sp. BB1-1-1]|uniref:UbiA family prenyltransferase n=1 Tax=Streptomyces sp. BB1-1-1 TaxID=3074430 RepID=UPI002877AA31|nr:UbiA family prenyltransferase [Streptomyces sp. BB1-1-1]WND33495.1 UbiA family prenyltransferase [Streptomyces sp. BB1-1-1]